MVTDLASTSRWRKIVSRSFLTLCAALFAAVVVVGQGFSAGSPDPPSVKESDLFVSIQGRFSIALPDNYHGFTPLSANTSAGLVLGDSYDWVMKEGRFAAGFVDRREYLETPANAKVMLDFMRDGLIERSKSRQGKLVGEESISGIGHPGRELKMEFPDGLFIQRIFLVANRMYLVSVVLHNDQRSSETSARKILDTFKLLKDAELDAARKKIIGDATPGPLPQTPVAPRAGSDARDEGLKGKVKSLFTETEDLAGETMVSGRKPASMEAYNEKGNLTKTQRYDWKGNLREIEVFGYIDGNRVSSSGYIRHEYDPPPMMMPAAPGEKQVQRDPRYATRFKYSYDSKGRLAERTVFGNDDRMRHRCVYEYENSKEIESCYSDGKMYYKSTSVLDANGNELERTTERESSTPGRNTVDKYSYTYEFDSKQNWIKKITSKWVTRGGRSYFETSYADYRTIVYY